MPDLSSFQSQVNIGQRLKELRQQQSLSLEQAAALCQVSKPMLSQIERGSSIPTITTLWKIATGLKTPLSYFLHSPKAEFTLASLDPASMITAENEKMKAWALFPYDPVRSHETFFIEFEPHCHHHSPPHAKGVEEYILPIQGSLTIILNDQPIVLQENQALRFSADQNHTYLNDSDKPCTVYNMIFYPG